MAIANVLAPSNYSKLVGDIRRIIDEGRQIAASAANEELVITYWKVGERITKEHLTENAGYTLTILEDLSQELDIDLSTLKRCYYFFQSYKSAPRGTHLTWSHYKKLLTIEDTKKRKFYEKLAEEENLNRNQLAEVINERRYEFAKEGNFKTKTKLKRPTEPTYVYKALVERVVDGDTLLLRIDLGFTVLKEQRIRLAGIDTPAMDEPKGREAYQFVRDQLAQADFVMVKTNKIDVYGRYVGHIFYSFTEKNKDKIFTQGKYLNQELLDRRFAQFM